MNSFYSPGLNFLTLPQDRHVVTTCLETILVLEFAPGERDFLQDLHIILEIPESGLLPCLLPTLNMSLAAAFAISMSVEMLLESVSDNSDIDSAASDFLFREVLDRLCPLLEI